MERLLSAGVGAAPVGGCGVDVGAPAPPSPSSLPLAGLSFVVTGKVAGLTRSGAAAAVAAAGGRAVASVSSSTAALVAGDAPGGAKVAAAEAAGVAVVDAAEFFDENGVVVWRPPPAEGE